MTDKHLQFLEIPRKDPDKLPIEVRTTEFREIYSQYGAETAAQQAGRCIACGSVTAKCSAPKLRTPSPVPARWRTKSGICLRR